jgi:hypothetical protein
MYMLMPMPNMHAVIGMATPPAMLDTTDHCEVFPFATTLP